MSKIQLFLNNFNEMTFKGKGAFWGVVLSIVLIVLVYIFAERLRESLKKKSAILLIIPILLLGCFVLLLSNSCKYVPLAERSAQNDYTYAWEQTTKKSELNMTYHTDIKDPATGNVYEQSFGIGDILEQLSFKETSDHVAEDFTVTSKDETTAITFRTDGTYLFSAADGGAEESGKYVYENKELTLTPDEGEEIKVGKTSSKLRYTTADGAYQQEYGIKDLKEMFVIEETSQYVPEACTVTSTDESTTLTFNPDGSYVFRAESSGAEETGQYVYRGNEMVLANAEGSSAFAKNFSAKIGWLIYAVIIAVLLVLVFVFQSPIKKFLDRHPLIWLLIPAAILIYFVYVAIGWNIWVSVSDWPEGSLDASYGWGGFGQYVKMVGDSSFWSAVLNTLKLFLVIPVCLLLGLLLALVMDQGLKGTPVFRTLILLPFALSFVVTGLIWQQMFNGTGGILVEFFKLFGINENIPWLSNNTLVMYSIMLVMVWQFSGYVAVIFLAAIKNVPVNNINAAKLDGAYMPRIYWKMILPQMKGAVGSCITILAMYALRSFDLIYSLTSYTNPASATLPIMMYNQMFAHNNYAYAAAISCFLLAMVLVLILPLTYATNRGKR